MAQTIATPGTLRAAPRGGRTKFLVGGLLIIAAIAYLIVTSTQNTAQYFYTVQEIKDRGSAVVGQNVRISGAVIGDSIQYDAGALELRFTVANVPADQKQIDAQGGLAAVLKAAVADPKAAHMDVLYVGVKPDLMKGEAQAIMDGRLDSSGLFHADTLLMKCPTRYEDAAPTQVAP
ncbi:MAG: cytochrome c maturation protein CcmE [Chloroflexi bacterium]|nr:cytochrome c maturation protein CcmE [Chloroflexota bacterium]MBI5292424.1 cytochrome c maturation protein CcmE [Chloroflexota bacterium]MBI5828001.1 cytochrome c maturation protein CcmE [Chloroflexota bacterium]